MDITAQFYTEEVSQYTLHVKKKDEKIKKTPFVTVAVSANKFEPLKAFISDKSGLHNSYPPVIYEVGQEPEEYKDAVKHLVSYLEVLKSISAILESKYGLKDLKIDPNMPYIGFLTAYSDKMEIEVKYSDFRGILDALYSRWKVKLLIEDDVTQMTPFGDIAELILGTENFIGARIPKSFPSI